MHRHPMQREGHDETCYQNCVLLKHPCPQLPGQPRHLLGPSIKETLPRCAAAVALAAGLQLRQAAPCPLSVHEDPHRRHCQRPAPTSNALRLPSSLDSAELLACAWSDSAGGRRCRSAPPVPASPAGWNNKVPIVNNAAGAAAVGLRWARLQ